MKTQALHLGREDKSLRATGHLHFWSFPITFLIKFILGQGHFLSINALSWVISQSNLRSLFKAVSKCDKNDGKQATGDNIMYYLHPHVSTFLMWPFSALNLWRIKLSNIGVAYFFVPNDNYIKLPLDFPLILNIQGFLRKVVFTLSCFQSVQVNLEKQH